MWLGIADYHYWIFSLNEDGGEQVFLENHVEFDTNFQSAYHQGFDAERVSAFLEEVHGYLDESTLLLSTESGELHLLGSGADFREDAYFWDDFCPYDETLTMEENVRNYEAAHRAARGAA